MNQFKRGDITRFLDENIVLEDGQPSIVTNGNRQILKIGDGVSGYYQLDDLLEKDTSHNAVFRGKNLDNYTISQLHQMISNGDFSDIYVGDYIDVSIPWGNGYEDHRFRVAGVNIFLGTGSSSGVFNTPHIVLVSDYTCASPRVWNSSTDISEGYYGSSIYNLTIPLYNTAFQNAFYNYILSHDIAVTTEVSTGQDIHSMMSPYGIGVSSNSTNAQAYLNLMNEVQVMGYPVWSSSGYDICCQTGQFPLFRLAPQYRWSYLVSDKTTPAIYWLTNINRRKTTTDPDSCRVSGVSYYGNVGMFTPTSDYYFRPYFLFG